MIDHLDIPSFMPCIQQYFGHFPPTVRELSLQIPKGSRRQTMYFIGLFQHLEDLTLVYDEFSSQEEPTDDLTLFPLFTPPLRGWLKLTCLRGVRLLKDMIDLFGGLRFRWMDLFNVDGMPLLLDASANTLEALVLYLGDPRCECFSPQGMRISTNGSTVSSPLQDFDLSRNKSFHTLQIKASYICHTSGTGSLDAASNFLNHTLSTITSPKFSNVIVVYVWSDFLGVGSWKHPDQPHLREISRAERAEEVSRHRRVFEVFRRVHKVGSFWLQLCASVWDPVGEYAMGILKEAVAEEKASVGFDRFHSKPLVTYYPKRSRL